MTTRTDTSVLVEHAKTTPPSQIILKLTRPQRRIDLSSDEGPRSPREGNYATRLPPDRGSQVRSGLAAGGSWIRTIGPPSTPWAIPITSANLDQIDCRAGAAHVGSPNLRVVR